MGQDIFERKIDQIYENCKGAIGIADDVQVFGNEETHDSMFQEAKECIEKIGIMHSFDKCIIRTNIVALVTNTLQKESSLT